MIAERVETRARINLHEGQEKSGPPEPAAIFVYKDGTERQVEERISSSIFDKSRLVGKIIGEQKRLKERLQQIPRQLEELSKKRKSGRQYPQREKTQTRARLEKEKEGIPNKIIEMSRTLDLLRITISESNPLDPLRVEMSRKMAIREIKGEPLPGEEDWWRFVREKAPEIWDNSGAQGEKFEIAHALFIARWRLNRARLLSIQEEKNAEKEFYEVTGSISDETAEAMSSIITKITNHFTAPKKG